MGEYTIERLDAAAAAASVEALADITIDCVEGGASVSFMWPLPREKAVAFWEGVAARVARGHAILLAARDGDGICGTVQLGMDVPENQPHRADVAKMLVHRRARRLGIGAALLRRIEHEATAAGRTTLVLDRVTGGDAERLYTRAGWNVCGVIPNYALFPDGRPCATTVFWKDVGAPAGPEGAPMPRREGRGSAFELAIRDATEDDLEAINRMYNLEIDEGLATWDTTPWTKEERRDWFAGHDALNPVLVAELEGAVVGFAYVTLVSKKHGWRFTREDTIYIDEGFRGLRIGDRLLAALLERLRVIGVRLVVASITSSNEASIRLHARHGFTVMGEMRNAGYKFGEWLSTTYMQVDLGEPDPHA